MSDQQTQGLAERQPGTSQTHEVAQFLRRYHIALVVLEGDEAGENILVTRLPFLVGRGKRATMRITSDTVSRRHAQLRLSDDGPGIAPDLLSDDGRLEVIDGGSINGTFVNGERVEAALLENDDRVRFGSVCYRLVIEERKPKACAPD